MCARRSPAGRRTRQAGWWWTVGGGRWAERGWAAGGRRGCRRGRRTGHDREGASGRRAGAGRVAAAGPYAISRTELPFLQLAGHEQRAAVQEAGRAQQSFPAGQWPTFAAGSMPQRPCPRAPALERSSRTAQGALRCQSAPELPQRAPEDSRGRAIQRLHGALGGRASLPERRDAALAAASVARACLLRARRALQTARAAAVPACARRPHTVSSLPAGSGDAQAGACWPAWLEYPYDALAACQQRSAPACQSPAANTCSRRSSAHQAGTPPVLALFGRGNNTRGPPAVHRSVGSPVPPAALLFLLQPHAATLMTTTPRPHAPARFVRRRACQSPPLSLSSLPQPLACASPSNVDTTPTPNPKL